MTPESPPAREENSEEESSDRYDYSNAEEDSLGEQSSSSLVIDCLANTNMARAAARIFDVAMSQMEDFTLMVGRGEEDVRMEGDGAVASSSTWPPSLPPSPPSSPPPSPPPSPPSSPPTLPPPSPMPSPRESGPSSVVPLLLLPSSTEQEVESTPSGASVFYECLAATT